MRKLLKVSAVLVAVALVSVWYLMRFHGLRVERDGSGIWPVLSFYDSDRHMAAIEQNRAARTAPPAPAPVEPVPAAKVAEKAAETPAEKPYWTDFRGPLRDGRYAERAVSFSWPKDGPPRQWRKPIGGGYASFVSAHGKAFTIEQRRNQEVAAAYDLTSGQEVWSHGWDALFQESMGGDGPRATPVWNEGRLYVLGAAGELRCLNEDTGRRVWSKNILEDNGAGNLTWGMAGSPLVVDDKLIVLPGGAAGKSVVAYNKLTGERIWNRLDDKQAYVSPMLVTLAGRRQILVVTSRRAVGMDPEDGQLLWEYPWVTSYEVNSAQPVIVGPDRFILSAGYDHGAALVQVTRNGDSFTASRVWENKRMKNKFASSVFHQGHLYGLDEAILACVDASTGELKWKGGRYGYGQLVIAGGHLIVTTEDGDVALVRASPERHEELLRFPAIDGKTWNSPAIAGGLLLVRNGVEMTAFRLN